MSNWFHLSKLNGGFLDRHGHLKIQAHVGGSPQNWSNVHVSDKGFTSLCKTEELNHPNSKAVATDAAFLESLQIIDIIILLC